jgi:hypothetical protein
LVRETPRIPHQDVVEPGGPRPEHYADYRHLAEDITEIFAAFTVALPHGEIAELARAHPRIPASTIYGWYDQWLTKPAWRPDRTNRYLSHRALNPEVEERLVGDIERRLADQEHVSSRELSTMAKRMFIIHLSECKLFRFRATASFRERFLRDHGFSMRTPTHKKKAYTEDPQVIQAFKDAIEDAARRLGEDRVWNMDETGWKDIQASGKTVAYRGCESVHVDVHGDPKAQVTAVCTISKAGRKLAPIYILRGTTERAVKPFEAVIGPMRATFSPNSWMDTTVMKQYLEYLHIASGGMRCALVMDSFGAHFPEEAMGIASDLDIEVIPVPKGLTGQWQPLDRRCFGPLKRMSQFLWGQKSSLNPHMKWDHIEAAKLLEEAWDALKTSTVLSAWDFGDGDDADEDDDSLDEEEGHNSQEGDPTFTMQTFRQVQEGETTESEPGSDGVVLRQMQHVQSMVQQSHQRTAAHRKEEDKVVKVDTGVPIHQLKPPLTGAMARIQDKRNALFWQKMATPPPEKKEKPGPGTPRSPAFPPTSARRYNQPEPVIGPDGRLFPQSHYPPVGGDPGEQSERKDVPFI